MTHPSPFGYGVDRRCLMRVIVRGIPDEIRTEANRADVEQSLRNFAEEEGIDLRVKLELSYDVSASPQGKMQILLMGDEFPGRERWFTEIIAGLLKAACVDLEIAWPGCEEAMHVD